MHGLLQLLKLSLNMRSALQKYTIFMNTRNPQKILLVTLLFLRNKRPVYFTDTIIRLRDPGCRLARLSVFLTFSKANQPTMKFLGISYLFKLSPRIRISITRFN